MTPTNPPAPALAGATRLGRIVKQSLTSYPNTFPIFHHQFINLHQLPLVNQQFINQLVINLLFSGLQVSKLVLSTVLLYPLEHQFTLSPLIPSILGVSGETLKINEIPRYLQYTEKSPKLSPKTSQSVQNEVLTGN